MRCFPLILACTIVEVSGISLFIGRGGLDSRVGTRLTTSKIVLRPCGSVCRSVGGITTRRILVMSPKELGFTLCGGVPRGIGGIRREGPTVLFGYMGGPARIRGVHVTRVGSDITRIEFVG